MIAGQVCPECGSMDLYLLADMLPEPEPCCGEPSIVNNPIAYRQRCTNCGTWLKGTRLEIARTTAR